MLFSSRCSCCCSCCCACCCCCCCCCSCCYCRCSCRRCHCTRCASIGDSAACVGSTGVEVEEPTLAPTLCGTCSASTGSLASVFHWGAAEQTKEESKCINDEYPYTIETNQLSMIHNLSWTADLLSHVIMVGQTDYSGVDSSQVVWGWGLIQQHFNIVINNALGNWPRGFSLISQLSILNRLEPFLG